MVLFSMVLFATNARSMSHSTRAWLLGVVADDRVLLQHVVWCGQRRDRRRRGTNTHRAARVSTSAPDASFEAQLPQV